MGDEVNMELETTSIILENVLFKFKFNLNEFGLLFKKQLYGINYKAEYKYNFLEYESYQLSFSPENTHSLIDWEYSTLLNQYGVQFILKYKR